MRHLPLVVALVFAGGCHPLACFHPSDLPKEPPLILESKADWPKADVEVLVDDLGIPHIYGQDEEDLAYALGVMHARDRLWQMYLFVHAGQGRLTELLGEDLLPIDRDNRLLTYRMQEQLDAASERDRRMTEAYCAGVNEGATMVKRTAEMALLGVDWEPIEPVDVLSIVRLQQWDQSVGFGEELARWRATKALQDTEPNVLAELLADTPTDGVPIVDATEHTGAAFTPPEPPAPAGHRPPSPTSHAAAAYTRAPPAASWEQQRLIDDVARMFRRGGKGASNSWSVHGSLTAAGVPVLANDPHLGHSAPGIFYMVHMEAPDFSVVGGSFVGIPSVLIGHGRNVAWGITNAFADTQDIVVIDVPQGQVDNYVVDGTTYAFGRETQRFKLGKAADSEVVTETLLTTIFGPVLPSQYGAFGDDPPLVDPGEHLALQWTAAEFPAESAGLLGAFWDLAKAQNLDEAHAAVQSFASPAMSFNMAFTDGTIAYRLSGIVPLRDEQRADFPRDGARRSSKWSGRLPADQKPQTENPAKGYIVAANQRVVENDAVSQRFVGFEGFPYRASRIDERIRQLLNDGKPSTADLLSIQQDATSVEARALAPIFGAHCPSSVPGHDDQRVNAFCNAVGGFDGVHGVDSLASAYERLRVELFTAVLEAHVDPLLAVELRGQSFSRRALVELIEREHAGEVQAAVFDDPATSGREGLDGFMDRAAKRALDILVEETGGSEGDWRWGKLHTLSLRGALSSAPVVGFLFQTSSREESGVGSAPRAENADPNNKLRVGFGAGLRLIAEMTDPPTVRMINDSGQSGHFGHRHLEDQYPLWTKGEPRVLLMGKDAVRAVLDGAMTIKPRP